jgi:hypothetical protein
MRASDMRRPRSQKAAGVIMKNLYATLPKNKLKNSFLYAISIKIIYEQNVNDL